MSTSQRIDSTLALAFAIAGAALGSWIIWRYLPASFYQIFMPEIVHSACGQGWVHHDIQPKALLDFLFMRVPSLDCSSLVPPDPPLPQNAFVKVHFYLAKFVDFVWRHSSIQYRNLWPVAAVLVGLYASGVFVLLRLFFSIWLSIVGAAVLTFSPVHVGMIMFIRDYSKAPFFIWSLIFLIVASRARTARLAMLWAALGGAVIGVGYGFRQDILVMLPLGLLLFAATCSSARWRTQLAAAVVFIALTLGVASPMLKFGDGGGFGSPLMQGLTEPYRAYLALGAAPYSFGARYSDELTLSSIAADLSVHDTGWEAREPQPWAGMSQSILRSGPYVMGWLPLFSGDMTTQSLKSAMWILGLPAMVAPERVRVNWGVPVVSQPEPSMPGAYVYSWIARSWLPWIGLVGFTIFLWQIWSLRSREAFALALVFGALLSYTAIQFALRHVFHLEFLWVAAMLALIRAPFHLRAMARCARSFLPTVGVAALALLGVTVGLIAYQESQLRAQFAALLNLPRETLPLANESGVEGKVLLRVPVPDDAKALVEGPPDAMDNTMGQRGSQWKVMAIAERWLITIDSINCPLQSLTLGARYQTRPTVWQPLDHEIRVEIRPGITHILMPAFYRATQYLPGITLPQASAACVSRIERITGATRLPSVLTAVLAPGWQTTPLHRAFGDFPVQSLSGFVLPTN